MTKNIQDAAWLETPDCVSSLRGLTVSPAIKQKITEKRQLRKNGNNQKRKNTTKELK